MPAKKTKKQKLIVGNWKMNPQTADDARRIIKIVKAASGKLKNSKVVACPPFVYIPLVKPSSQFLLGAQDVFFEEQGSYTGEISVGMLGSIGVSYVIIGHSERRKMGETDEVVAEKTSLAIKTSFNTIVCVGEAVRDPQGTYLEFLKNQIKTSLSKIQRKHLPYLIIAYEPIWAIGATEAMTPRDIHEMNIFVKKILSDLFGQEDAMKVPILYGGAVNARNAAEIVQEGEVDGLLIGRESINPPGFIEILKTIDELK